MSYPFEMQLIVPEFLSGISLSDATFNLLTKTGIPVYDQRDNGFFSFWSEPKILDGRYVVIGYDYGSEIRIDAITDNVLSVDAESGCARLVNSDMRKLIECLSAYESAMRRIEVCDDEDELANGEVVSLQKEFEIIDSTAMSSEDNYWSVIIEQMIF